MPPVDFRSVAGLDSHLCLLCTKLDTVVAIFEVLLVAVSALIAWFGLYVVYRLVRDES